MGSDRLEVHMSIDSARWQERLALLAGKYGVPGATLAVLVEGEIGEAASGVLNIRTGASVTSDSLFQIGSITKLWTATIVMQLVDEGKVDLDVPVVTYLPEFKVADSDVTAQVTTRHLLTHTSGIDGDLFLDTGRGDDCLEKYVAAMAALGQSHPLGAVMSYCNSGYILLGRLIEVLVGDVWEIAVRHRLFEPMGLTTAGTLPEEALLYASAVGHVTPTGGELQVAPVWGIFRSCGPAGLIHATARDVIKFAKLHLADGLTDDGVRVLSAKGAQAMRTPQVEVRDPWTLGSHWGLGWILMDWNDRPVYGHDGSTLGQEAFLRVVPADGVAVALLTNGGHARDLFHELSAEILSDLGGPQMPTRLEPPATAPEFALGRFAGRYQREGVELTIVAESDRLVARVRVTSALAEAAGNQEQPPLTFIPVQEDVFVAKGPGDGSWTPAVFFQLDDGSEYLHFGGRATPKVG